jgi:predicted lactoylglutathione lyase
MLNQIFVNLPVVNLKRSVDFFTELGFTFSWGFEDLDGHLWDLFYMTPEHIQG